VVVPFGCAALILLDDDEQAKFTSRCVLMLFMHYAEQHPLFTYAFYSPKTKRIIFRQDCIFLPTVFPMRHARSQLGQNPDGEALVTYRSPEIMRDGPSVVSFQDWAETDPLPTFDDDVSGFELYSPGCFPDEVGAVRPEGHPGHCPDHVAFAPSFVHVPSPTVPTGRGNSSIAPILIPQSGPIASDPLPRRSSRVPAAGNPLVKPHGPVERKAAKQRWFYEPVLPSVSSTDPDTTRACVMVSSSAMSGTAVVPGNQDSSSGSSGVETASGSSGVETALPGLVPSVGVSEATSTGEFELTAQLAGRLYTPLHFDGQPGDGFTITLLYPGGERESHAYSVARGMPVSFLRSAPLSF
jgi:hypothetical protein